MGTNLYSLPSGDEDRYKDGDEFFR